MLDGRGFFQPDKEVSLAILTDCKGKRRSMAGKRPLRQRGAVVNTGSYINYIIPCHLGQNFSVFIPFQSRLTYIKAHIKIKGINQLFAEGWHMIGDIVTVTVDRPLGTYHPKHKDLYYPINYGYIEGIIAPDGEEQDAYILGVNEAVEKFTGKIIAIIHRFDDVEEKWVVCPENITFTKEEIMEKVRFQEQYFQSEIII